MIGRVLSLAGAIVVSQFVAPPVAEAATSATIGTATLARSYVEIEVEFTLSCTAYPPRTAWAAVQVSQPRTGATGSAYINPLACDDTTHAYTAHVFAQNTSWDTSDATAWDTSDVTITLVSENFNTDVYEYEHFETSRTAAPTRADVNYVYSAGGRAVEIGSAGELVGKPSNGSGAHGYAVIPVTVTCPVGDEVWISVATEQEYRKRVEAGTGDGTPYQHPYNVYDPYVTCDGTPHTHTFEVAGVDGGVFRGNASVAVFVNGYVGPDLRDYTYNADAVRTVALR